MPDNIPSTKNEAMAAAGWPEIRNEQKPWTRWWWLGSAVDEANLTRELEEFRAAGFGGVEITPIYGIIGQEARHVEYLSDRWLALARHVCSEARRLGLGVDIVPGSGWRMGGPGVPPDQRAVRLCPRKEPDRDGDVARSDISEFSGEQVKRPAPGGDGFTIDMLDRNAVTQYLERFNARFFSAVPPELVRAQFHDSWEYGTDWTRLLFDEFRVRRGYPLENYLEALHENGGLQADQAARVRYDYRVTIEELLIENFSSNWNDICGRKGLLTRNQSHGSPGNLLDIYAVADIPETEIFTDRVNPLINAFASSAGHVAGRRLISAESFTWLSDHWLSDLGKIKRYADHLFLSGINHIFYHGTAYSPADAPWPGWLFYASTQVNNRNPLWPHLPALNDYIARCQSFLQAGSSDNDVLLYWPIADEYMTRPGRLCRFSIDGDNWPFGDSLKRTARNLWDGGVLFDYVSDRRLQQASVEKGLVKTPGGRYSAIVLPPFQYCPPETAAALLRLAGAGVPIVCHGAAPAWDVPGLQDMERRRGELAETARVLESRRSFTAAADPVAALKKCGVRVEGWQDDEGLRCVRRKLDNGDSLYFIVNRGAGVFEDWIRPANSFPHARLLDPWTGESETVAADPDKGVMLKLEAAESVLLILSAKEQPAAVRKRSAQGTARSVDITGPWKISFPAGGPVCPAALERAELVSVSKFGGAEFECFAGAARYETLFDLGHGQACGFWLDLGKVEHGARVTLNGESLGLCVLPPYRYKVPDGLLKERDNHLAVEVASLAANRIRDLDRRGVPWKIFHDINFVHINYKPFDASSWEIRNWGLLGPVRLCSGE